MSDQLQTAGLLGSTSVTSLPRYYEPHRHPLAFCRLPGVPGYTTSLLRRFRDGTRRASPVAQHVLVIVLSLSPRQSVLPHQSACDNPCCLRPIAGGSASGIHHFRGHLCVYFHYGPMTRNHPVDGFVDRLQEFSSPPSCYPSYEASDFCLGGTQDCFPLNMPAFAGRTPHLNSDPA